MNKTKIEMKIIEYSLKFLAIILILIIVLKLIIWLISDVPISRGSLLILSAYSSFLILKNKYTYFLLVSLMIFCVVYKVLNNNKSGYLIVDFLSSIFHINKSIDKQLFLIPYIFYFVTFFVMLLPVTRHIYFKKKK